MGNFGVRNYDDGLGRFMSVDDWWEKYRSWSPYHYSFNNPLTLKDPSGLGVPNDLSRFQPAWANDISGGLTGGVYVGQTAGLTGVQILGRLVNLVLDAVVLNALVEDGAQKAEEKVQEKVQEKSKDEAQSDSDDGDDGSEYYKPKTRDTQNRTPKKAGSQSKMGNNQRENKQFDDAVKELKLNKDQAQRLHRAIDGKDYSYKEILELGGELF